MTIKQLTIFVENTTGRLGALTRILAENGIDLRAAVIAETNDFGILRCIVRDPEKARAILNQNGFTASVQDVLAVVIPDRAGAFDAVLQPLAAAGVAVKYIYSTVTSDDGEAVIVLKADQQKMAEEILKAEGIALAGEDKLF